MNGATQQFKSLQNILIFNKNKSLKNKLIFSTTKTHICLLPWTTFSLFQKQSAKNLESADQSEIA